MGSTFAFSMPMGLPSMTLCVCRSYGNRELLGLQDVVKKPLFESNLHCIVNETQLREISLQS